MRKLLVLSAIAATALLMAGCDLFGITGLTLDRPSATVMVNDTMQLTASVLPASASAAGLVWASDHPLIASVDSAGLVTALAPGAASISVSNASGSLSAICAVTVPAIYHISSNIATSATWTAGNTYFVTAAVHILSGATLTIQAGTVVKFFTNSNSDAGLIADAGSSINAAGTGTAADKAIVFTSFKDSSVGTAIPGAAITPAGGDWANIAVIGTGNVFTYCVFSYASANALLIGESWTGSAQVDHCVFRNNSGAAGDPFGAALNASYSATTTTITNNAFYNNSYPLIIGPEISLDDSNVFHNPDDAAVKNAVQAVYIGGFFNAQCGYTVSRTLAMTEVPFVTGRQIEIHSGATLTFAAGTALKFMTGLNMFVNPGASLSYDATTVFTSVRDDSVKGDTDGPTTPAAAVGDWHGIYKENSDSAGDGYFLTGANIRFSSDVII
jgi:hypothetical protein